MRYRTSPWPVSQPKATAIFADCTARSLISWQNLLSIVEGNVVPQPEKLRCSAMKNSRRQHHVWRSYLEAWAIDQIIFCLQGDRIFPSNVSGVAVERDFHKLQALTSADIKGVRWLVGEPHPATKRVDENFLASFGLPGWLQTNPPPHLIGDDEYETQLRYQIINAEEDWHAAIEQEMVPILAALRCRNVSVYADDKQCIPFLHFLCLQSLRTKGVRDRIAARTTEINGFSVARCWNILRHIFAVRAGASLYLERKKRPLWLLKNNTDTQFITGDQPVINLFASPNREKSPELLAYYYPVSPTTAIVLDEVEHRSGYTSGPVTDEQVKTLNRCIQDASHRQVFGNSEAILISLTEARSAQS